MRLSDIGKGFKSGVRGSPRIEVLKNFNLSVSPAEFVAIVGPSGSGKSTLLNIMGLLDAPDTGSVECEGKNLFKLSRHKRTLWRRLNLGFIFQFHNLLPEFTALENVSLIGRIAGTRALDAKNEASALLSQLQLDGKEHKLPSALSGGEQQRVAIARALINRPKIILADEPTGNLDHSTGLLVFDMLQTCAREFGITIVMVTHNRELSAKCDRVISLY